MANYDEAKAVRILKKNKGIHINGTTIEVLINSASVGNGSWGKIDYLSHYCGYTVIMTKSLGNKSARINDFDEEVTDSNNIKAVKRANKLNIAAMAKASMLNMAAMAKASMKRVKTK